MVKLQHVFRTRNLKVAMSFCISRYLVGKVCDSRIGLSATRGQRASAIEELYVNGAQHGTATFQIGDNALDDETS